MKLVQTCLEHNQMTLEYRASSDALCPARAKIPAGGQAREVPAKMASLRYKQKTFQNFQCEI